MRASKRLASRQDLGELGQEYVLAGLHSATRVSSFRMAKPNSHAPLGEGGRFAAFVARLVAEGKSVEQAKAIAAAAGRRKYGKARFQSMAAKGRKS